MRSDESNSPILRRAGGRGLRERSLHGDDTGTLSLEFGCDVDNSGPNALARKYDAD